MQLLSTNELKKLLSENQSKSRRLAVIAFTSPAAGFNDTDWITLPSEPGQFARAIYSSLRKLDRRKG
ncbi:hypothetical protein ABTC78_19060, partial [Acinetobacter baumannii]